MESQNSSACSQVSATPGHKQKTPGIQLKGTLPFEHLEVDLTEMKPYQHYPYLLVMSRLGKSGDVDLGMYTSGIKGCHKDRSGSLAKEETLPGTRRCHKLHSTIRTALLIPFLPPATLQTSGTGMNACHQQSRPV
ncbi:unnamed protein product [Rangifer tarandus platyrhynchus]|uniref:Uncharacterized protein n=1 Tax=Rangifer tarandus platyrhynchus TaxID=3082113 RepID=A0AC59YTJ7_RANTA